MGTVLALAGLLFVEGPVLPAGAGPNNTPDVPGCRTQANQMPSTPEPRLEWAVERCRQGDRNAFRAIVDAYGDRLFCIAYLITRDQHLAEDAMQEALVQAWRNIKSFRAGTNLAAWLNRILLNQVKKQSRRKRVFEKPTDAATRLRGSGAPSSESADGADHAVYLRAALQTLSEDQRTTVVFRFYMDYTIPEIAETTGWAEGTVKSRLSRAMTALRGNIDRDAVLEPTPHGGYQS